MKKIIDKIVAEKETIKYINLSEQYSLYELPEIIKECKALEKLTNLPKDYSCKL